jgi:hypothetical protein
LENKVENNYRFPQWFSSIIDRIER